MQTKEFLVFKDRLIEYLRNFIKGLQRNVGAIEECLLAIDNQDKQEVYNKIIQYEWQIPRMDVEITVQMIEENVKGRGRSIYEWFVEENGRENEAGKLFDATNEIIRGTHGMRHRLVKKCHWCESKRRIPQSGRIIFAV